MTSRRSCSPFFLVALLAIFTLLGGCIGRPPLSPLPLQYTLADSNESAQIATSDSLLLFGQWWLPQQKPRAVILLIHGTGLHSGFYAPWASHARDHGFAVFGLDLRGWGQSQGYGRPGYVEDYKKYLDDLKVGYEEVKRRYPDLPVFLQGESLGGAVVLLGEISGQTPADGLILNAPAVAGNPGFGFFRAPQFLANFGLSVAGFSARGWPNFPSVPMNRLAARVVFIDKEASQRFVEDPHCTHSWLAADYVTSVAESMKYVREQSNRVTTPLLVQHGTRDRLVPLSSSEKLVKRAASRDKALRVYNDLSHATLHVKGRERVWRDILLWMDQRLEADGH